MSTDNSGAAAAGDKDGAAAGAAAAAASGAGGAAGAGGGAGGAAGAEAGKPAAQQKPAHAAGNSDDGTAGAAPIVAMPDNWRDLVAGEDSALKNILGRYRSVDAFGKAHRELHDRLRAGGALKDPPGENATDAEKKAWREQQGIPEKPEGYLEKLKVADGVVLSEEDKAIANNFFATAHKKGWSQEQVNQAMEWYFDFSTSTQAKMTSGDEDDRTTAVRSLRDEFGAADYKRNMAALQTLHSNNPDNPDLPAVMDLIYSARGPDGKLLGNNPQVLKAFTQMALDLNPAARAIPGDPETAGKGVTARLAELNTALKTRDWTAEERAEATRLNQIQAQIAARHGGEQR